jgi:hypothetical protein
VDEQAFRYNNCATKDNPLTDADRFALALSQIVNKRLTYAELTGKVEERPEAFLRRAQSGCDGGGGKTDLEEISIIH